MDNFLPDRLWLRSNQVTKLAGKCFWEVHWRGRNQIRIYRRSERKRKQSNLPSKREGQGRIFQSGMSCLVKPPSFPLLSCLFTLVWYLFRPQKSTATVAQVPKESLSLLTSFISLLPLFLYFCLTFNIFLQFFSSAASSKCLQITQLWNSTLHLYLYVYLDNTCPVFKVLFSGRQKKKFMISLYFFLWFSIGKGC